MRKFGKIVIWILAIFGGIGAIGIVAIIVALTTFKDEVPSVSDKTVLWLDFNQAVTEKQEIGGFFGGPSGSVRLIDILDALDAAGSDPRIKGVVAEFGGGQIGMAKAQEIRTALHKFRDSGKFTIAYAEDLGSMSGGMIDYYIASAFEEIWLQPSGGVGFTGFSIEQPYLKGALDELGVIPEFEQRHEYKGGTDMFTKNAMPAPVKNNLQKLADGWLTQIITGVEEDNPDLHGMGRNLVDNGPYLGSQAIVNGLVDRLAYWDELESELDLRAGTRREEVSVADYLLVLNLESGTSFDDKPDTSTGIALVYGVGAIDPNAGGVSDDSQFSPYQVADALRDAREDDAIKAVVFRVDSPGGAYAQSDMVWREVGLLKAANKPVVVTMGDYAASGGYFVAMAADYVIASPGTITGSIGVYSGKFATKALWDKLGINWDGVKSGENAGMWGMVHGFSAKELQKFQQSVDFVYEDFTGKAALDRDLDPASIDNAARGRVWTGVDALRMGLVDELGGLSDAINAARSALKLTADDETYLVELPAPLSPFDQIMALMSGEGDFLMNAFVDLKISEQLGMASDRVEALKPTVGMVHMSPLIIR